MRKRMNLYKVVDQNGKQVFENLLTAKQVTEKTGCTKNNVAQAAANFALVNKKYRIIPEDIKLSKIQRHLLERNRREGNCSGSNRKQRGTSDQRGCCRGSKRSKGSSQREGIGDPIISR